MRLKFVVLSSRPLSFELGLSLLGSLFVIDSKRKLA